MATPYAIILKTVSAHLNEYFYCARKANRVKLYAISHGRRHQANPRIMGTILF